MYKKTHPSPPACVWPFLFVLSDLIRASFHQTARSEPGVAVYRKESWVISELAQCMGGDRGLCHCGGLHIEDQVLFPCGT